MEKPLVATLGLRELYYKHWLSTTRLETVYLHFLRSGSKLISWCHGFTLDHGCCTVENSSLDGIDFKVKTCRFSMQSLNLGFACPKNWRDRQKSGMHLSLKQDFSTSPSLILWLMTRWKISFQACSYWRSLLWALKGIASSKTPLSSPGLLFGTKKTGKACFILVTVLSSDHQSHRRSPLIFKLIFKKSWMKSSVKFVA